VLFFITDQDTGDLFFYCEQRIGVCYDTSVIVWVKLKVIINNNKNITRLITPSGRKQLMVHFLRTPFNDFAPNNTTKDTNLSIILMENIKGVGGGGEGEGNVPDAERYSFRTGTQLSENFCSLSYVNFLRRALILKPSTTGMSSP